MDDKKYIEYTIDLAKKNVECGAGGPFAAIIVKNNEIIAEGLNSVTSGNDPTAHAEIMAIRVACSKLNTFQLKDCTIYSSCEPCPMCLGAIYWARPEKLIFAATKDDAAKAGFDDAFMYDEISKIFQNRKLKTFKIVSENRVSPFNLWLNKTDKIDY